MAIQSGRSYRIVNVKAGTVLDLSGTDGVSVSGFTANGGNNQKWYLDNSSGHWTFRCGTGKYLGLDGEVQDGTPVIGVNQPVQWDIRPDEQDGSVYRRVVVMLPRKEGVTDAGHTHYRIFVPNAPTAMNLDLSDHGNANPGTKVTLWTKWEGKHQCWKFEEGENDLRFKDNMFSFLESSV
ncbi:carbohydrate-binding module family 13 protein [Moniliophthora roreri]|uniref:Putative carbohydrate-binding module family 13 protein n=1 Tax=Moniliophthora roreri TaxID=221103 RepID=A0A0W0EW72_MONRR|nr:carbohydrate-binding module family 13 protein [Moniliophthora roreri]